MWKNILISASKTLPNACNYQYNTFDKPHFNHYCWTIWLGKIYLNAIENILDTIWKEILSISATNFKCEGFLRKHEKHENCKISNYLMKFIHNLKNPYTQTMQKKFCNISSQLFKIIFWSQNLAFPSLNKLWLKI